MLDQDEEIVISAKDIILQPYIKEDDKEYRKSMILTGNNDSITDMALKNQGKSLFNH